MASDIDGAKIEAIAEMVEELTVVELVALNRRLKCPPGGELGGREPSPAPSGPGPVSEYDHETEGLGGP